MYKVDDLKQVFIGRRGEGFARVVEIDVTSMADAYPGASFSIIMHRSDSDTPILCDTALTDNVLAWAVTPTCTAVCGIHPFEVRAIKNGQIAKSKTGNALVAYAVSDYAGEDVPEPIDTWVDVLEEYLEMFTEVGPSNSDDLDYILGVS